MATSDAGEPKLLRSVFGHLSKVLNESNTASLMEEAAGIMKLREVLRAAAVPGERLLSTIESVLLLLRSRLQSPTAIRSPQAGDDAVLPDKVTSRRKLYDAWYAYELVLKRIEYERYSTCLWCGILVAKTG